jgi:hypothetical protein
VGRDGDYSGVEYDTQLARYSAPLQITRSSAAMIGFRVAAKRPVVTKCWGASTGSGVPLPRRLNVIQAKCEQRSLYHRSDESDLARSQIQAAVSPDFATMLSSVFF